MDAIDASHASGVLGSASNDTPRPSLLTLILDTNPHAWNELHPRLSLSTAVANLLVFINAHLAFSHENRVAVIASHCKRAVWLHPTPTSASKPANDGPSNGTTTNGHQPAVDQAANANKYTPFATIESAFLRNLQTLLSSTQHADLHDPSTNEPLTTTPIAGALSLALSYINRVTLSLGSGQHNTGTTVSAVDASAQQASAPLNARILVVATSSDLATQYIPLMNAMFAAQHARVAIDVLKLAGETVLLQQAAFTTGGVFIAPGESGDGEDEDEPIILLPALMHALLPDATARRNLNMPTTSGVDFRAACFCHQRVVDLGYVCSICLSIFCSDDLEDEGENGGVGGEALPMRNGTGHGRKMVTCLTCGTRLVVGGDATGVAGAVGAGGEDGEKKKKKKKRKDLEGVENGRDSASATPAPS